MRRNILVLSLFAALTTCALAAEPAQKIRSVTLSECIADALEHNLDIKIERFTPMFSKNDLQIAYAGYDPGLSIRGGHSLSTSGGGFNPSIGLVPPTSSEADFLSSSVSGLGPMGFQYSLNLNLNENYGTAFTVLGGSNLFAQPFDNSSGSVGINMTQPLLKNFWIDGTRFNISLAKNRLKYSELVLRYRIMGILNSVEQSYYDLIYALESLKVQEKALDLADRLLAENRKREEVGAMAPLDVKQAEAEVSARRADLLGAQRLLDFQQNVLRKLISDDYKTAHGVDLKPSEELVAPIRVFDLQNSWTRGISQRPDLLQARLDLDRLGMIVRYNHNQMFPQFDVFGGYGYNASGVREFSDVMTRIANEDQPAWQVGGQFSIPLSNKAARYRYRSSKESKEQGELLLARLEQDVLAQIDDAIKIARTSYERVGATKKAGQFAQDALEAEQKKLENGKSTSFVVLRLQRDLTSARSEEIRAMTEYLKALAALAFAEGSTLERHKVALDLR